MAGTNIAHTKKLALFFAFIWKQIDERFHAKHGGVTQWETAYSILQPFLPLGYTL